MLLSEVDLIDTYKKWRNASGLFSCFFRCSPFASLKHYPDFELIKLEKEKTTLLINYTQLENTLLIIDIPMKEALDMAIALNKKGEAKIVLCMNFLFHKYGIVGSKEDVSKLIAYSDELTYDLDTKTYAFILDNDRYIETNEKILRIKFNNQYEITYEDLPSAELIKELDYNKVIVACRNEKEDLKNYINYLNNEKVIVEKIYI